ncbi:transcriptional regulator, TetR family [Jannaschia helgolandensis]|jgi:AcrR family transcriptional regulator|uniref:Transcriptional regulator, TetR family n=2 Tax=Jannaschia helgolandensis TaxID=188906 RepID=A0A1H7MPE7_9RHOB|nr:transcriptional regulator, TetR family [Jannaschia helgolandensis]|tara:strand:+ start:182 stop:778 length:597 start_codon:yes stop_codon:yes gene_type:complete
MVMERPVQKRTLETRARLIAAAEAAVARTGFEALRVEEIVLAAGVAKGTFFAHFKDKDALMDLLIGSRIDAHLDAIETAPAPRSPEDLVDRLMPLMTFMTCERYVFDVILRRSGAAAIEDIGPIARTFERYVRVVSTWIAGSTFRRDVPPDILAEGVQAFAIQVMALRFCALHVGDGLREPLLTFLDAWLCPRVRPSD